MEVMHTATDVNNRSLVRIAVDDRESRSQVIESLRLQPYVQLEVRRLSVGDYEVGTEWVFERKTIHDFAASLADGRLFHQVSRLARCPNGSALILEGPDQARAETGISPEAWQGTLISIGLAFRLPVIRSADPEETARLLIYAANQVGRRRDAVFVTAGRRARTLERQRIRMLTALPQIGPHRARLLLNHFGSVAAVVQAAREELMEVRGIGEHIAREIRAFVAGDGVLSSDSATTPQMQQDGPE
ncbi:MAG TPA: ERCC4 domain-containing protein [Verrucomicrobiota bacterium]|nr:ERCC4 domain-containing protein [Verrucomicrobiota bacterium]